MATAYLRRAWEIAQESLDRGVLIGVIALLPVAARLSPWVLPNGTFITPTSAVWIFAGLAGTSIAVLALQQAMTTFRGEQLAARLPSEIVADLFSSPEHRASFWRLMAIFVTSLWTLGPITQTKLPPSALTVAAVDVLLLLLTVISISRSGRRIFAGDSRVVAELVVSRLSDDFLGYQQARSTRFPPPSLVAGVATDRPDPFALTEQVWMRAVAAHDLTTARLVLRYVSGRVLGYLEGREFVARGVLAWLGELLSAVGRRALALDEPTAVLVVVLFEDVIKWTLQKRLAWHDRIELVRSFGILRRAAIEAGNVEVVSQGLYALGRMFPAVLKTAPSEEEIWILHMDKPLPAQVDHDKSNEWHHIYYDWIWVLGQDIEVALAQGLQDSYGTGQFIYAGMVDDVFRADNLGLRQKRDLIRHILWASDHAAHGALRSTIREPDLESPLLFRSEELDRKGLGDLVMPALQEWQRTVTMAAELGKLSWMALNHFAAAGRGYAREAQDERGILVARALRIVAEIIRRRERPSDDIHAGYDQSVDAIRSLARFDQRQTTELKTAVNAELAELGEKPEPLAS